MNIEKQLESIKDFNAIAGNLNKPVNPILEHELLGEELQEYIEACVTHNEVEQKDALCDLAVVLFGTIAKHGLWDKFPELLQEVCDSNMSKFCDTIEEASQSVEKYKDSGVHTYYEFIDTHKKYVIKRMDGKILKGINFFKPKL